MKLDNFTDIQDSGHSRRIERLVDPKSKQVGAIVKEIIECTMIFQEREMFEQVYRYLGGRKLVSISDWRFKDGFYYVRSRKIEQIAKKHAISISFDYIGLELEARSEYTPMEFKHRVIVQEDFSGWSVINPITAWPISSAGVGSQYESMYWYRRSSNAFAIASYVRPDGSLDKVLFSVATGTAPAIYVENLEAYASVKIRVTMANSGGTSDKGTLIFRFKDDGDTTASYKEAMALLWEDTALKLYKIENNTWTEVWSKELGLTRPSVTGSPVEEDWFELGVNLYGPIIEMYHEGKFIDYIKYDRFQVGSAGFTVNATSGALYVADLVVEKNHIPVYSLPVGAYKVDGFVHDSIYTKDGWVQRVLRPTKPVKFWAKAADDLGGLVRVWDMRDGDFDTPHRWEEVTSNRHEFKGEIFVENSICGIHYTGGRCYYMYNEHLKEVVSGFDTSAWWSQGYSLQNVAPFKGFSSPAATKGSLYRFFKHHEKDWMLHPKGEWNQNKTFDFPVINPEIEAAFMLYANKAGASHESGTRIASFNYNDMERGVQLCAPETIRGQYTWGINEKAVNGRANVERAKVTEATFISGLETSQLIVDGELDNAHLSLSQTYESSDLFEKVRKAVVHTIPTREHIRRATITVDRAISDPHLIPLREDTNAVDPSLGAISKWMVRNKPRGHQFTPPEALHHYNFDKASTKDGESWVQHNDVVPGLDTWMGLKTDDDNVFEFVDGVINEGIRIGYGSSGQVWDWTGEQTTSHTIGTHLNLSIFIRFMSSPVTEAATREFITLYSVGTGDFVNIDYYVTNKAFRIRYLGTTITDEIPLSSLCDGQWHLIRIAGGVGANVIHAFVDDQEWSADCGSPSTHKLDGVIIQNQFATTELDFDVDELMITEATHADIAPYYPSAYVLMKTEHELKAAINKNTGKRWDKWDSNKVLIQCKFDEGVEDIGPYKMAITPHDGYYAHKQGGFSVGADYAYSFTPTTSVGASDDEIVLDEGFTIMWRGAIVNGGKIVDFRTASAAEAIKLLGTPGGGLILTVQTASGENKYMAQVDNEYHSFAVMYSKGKCYLKVDDRGIPWTVKLDSYAEDAKFIQGVQYFGGNIIADFTFVLKALWGNYGFVSQRQNHWKTYYSFRYENTLDLIKPIPIYISKQSVELKAGYVTIRMEAGNPLILIEDIRHQDNDIRVYDENGSRKEWEYIITEDIIRDARRDQETSIDEAYAHKYMFVVHGKTANGFTVFNSPDAEDNILIDTISSIKYVYMRFQSTNKLVVGFYNWPIWHYLREGGEADGFGGSAFPDWTSWTFWTCAVLAGSGASAYYEFYSPEYGSFLLVVRSRYGRAKVEVGNSGDSSVHYTESYTGKSNYARPVTYAVADETAETDKIRITTSYNSGVEEIDYVMLLPLGNGLHFPTDFIQQILSRNS